MSKSLLTVKNLFISVLKKGKVIPLVKNVSFSIEKNQVLSFVGQSGSGKTITSLSLMGIFPSKNIFIEKGSISFEGKEIDYQNNRQRELLGKSISMIFQDPMTSLNPVYTIGRQIAEMFIIHEEDSKEQAKKKSIELLKEVKINNPEIVFTQYPHELSGGMRQRIMIAIAISCRVKLLIADEPTTALDVTIQKEILDLLKDLKEKYKISILFITHDFSLVANYADKVAVFYNGKMIDIGKTKTILKQPKNEYTKKLVDAVLNVNKKYSLKKTTSKNEEILSIKNLKIYYPIHKGFLKRKVGENKAVDDVSFFVRQGQVMGIVGESGCGKSSIAKALVGITETTDGEINIGGENYIDYNFNEMKKIRKKIQLIFQDAHSSMNPNLRIEDILKEPFIIHKIKMSKEEMHRKLVSLLESVDLQESDLKKYSNELSGGQKQRVVIARALATDPEVIIADEAVASLDVIIRKQILDLLKKIQKERNLTIVLISHDLGVIKYIAEKVSVIYRGKIVEHGDTEKVLQNPKNDYTKKLLASNLGV